MVIKVELQINSDRNIEFVPEELHTSKLNKLPYKYQKNIKFKIQNFKYNHKNINFKKT